MPISVGFGTATAATPLRGRRSDPNSEAATAVASKSRRVAFAMDVPFGSPLTLGPQWVCDDRQLEDAPPSAGAAFKVPGEGQAGKRRSEPEVPVPQDRVQNIV